MCEPRGQERGGDSLIQCSFMIFFCSSAASHLIVHGVFKVHTSNLGSVPLWLFSIEPLCIVEVPSACGIAASKECYRITRQAFECITFNHRHSLGRQDDRLKKKKSEHLVTDEYFMARKFMHICTYIYKSRKSYNPAFCQLHITFETELPYSNADAFCTFL